MEHLSVRRRLLSCAAALAAMVSTILPFNDVSAQTPRDVRIQFTDASTLTLVGKLMPGTPNPFHRVDTVRFKGFTKGENTQVRMCTGMSVAFTTSSSVISVKAKYGQRQSPLNCSAFAARGFDLYIKKDGAWTYAASAAPAENALEKAFEIIRNMDSSRKECLLYLPIYSELLSLEIGVEEGSGIEPLPMPFRHRVAIFGSSYTHGSSTSRPGMTYPAQLTRMTGIQFLSLGCSGNSKLQSYFADVLAATDADAFVFDAFSNPSVEQVKERLFPFIEKVQAAHPGVPLIFQKTIRRESRNFNVASERFEVERMQVADSLMRIACRKYKDVYWVDCTNASVKSHDTSVDGIHPTNYGYTLWAESVRKPITRILKKYGIR